MIAYLILQILFLKHIKMILKPQLNSQGDRLKTNRRRKKYFKASWQAEGSGATGRLR